MSEKFEKDLFSFFLFLFSSILKIERIFIEDERKRNKGIKQKNKCKIKY